MDSEIKFWEQHYRSYLRNMYTKCIPGNIRITYNSFVVLAYKCTKYYTKRITFNKYKPLV